MAGRPAEIGRRLASGRSAFSSILAALVRNQSRSQFSNAVENAIPPRHGPSRGDLRVSPPTSCPKAFSTRIFVPPNDRAPLARPARQETIRGSRPSGALGSPHQKSPGLLHWLATSRRIINPPVLLEPRTRRSPLSRFPRDSRNKHNGVTMGGAAVVEACVNDWLLARSPGTLLRCDRSNPG